MTRLRQPQDAGAVVGGGAIAGVIAAAVMLVVSMAWLGHLQLGANLVPRSAATLVHGPMALIGGAAPVWQGWLIVLAFGALMGLIYTAIGWHIRRWRTALIWGVLWSIAVWVGMGLWGLPAVVPALSAYAALIPGTWFLLHIIFGVVLSVSAPLRRGLGDAPAQAELWELPKAS